MTRLEFWAAVMGLLVTSLLLFNQVNGRFDRMQAETNARFDRMQAETNARFDAIDVRFDAIDVRFDAVNGRFDTVNDRFDTVNDRFDAAQVENSRQHGDLNRRFDELFEVIRFFEGRISRLEGRLDAQGAENAEP